MEDKKSKRKKQNRSGFVVQSFANVSVESDNSSASEFVEEELSDGDRESDHSDSDRNESEPESRQSIAEADESPARNQECADAEEKNGRKRKRKRGQQATNLKKLKIFPTKRNQKFRDEWVREHTWARPSNLSEFYFECKHCPGTLSCKKDGVTALRKHATSKKHVKNSKLIFPIRQTSAKNSAFNMFHGASAVSTRASVIELQLALLIAQHNLPLSLADDLVYFIKHIDLDQDVQKKLSCGRTKCTALICNVLGEYRFHVLIDKLKNSQFSLIIDESTDIGTIKHLVLVVRYVGQLSSTPDVALETGTADEPHEGSDFEVHDEFLALLEVTDATHKGLYQLIKTFFDTHEIPYRENLVGFASDGASVMMGKEHSVSVKLKADCPQLFIMLCICHSLARAVTQALKKLPSYLEETASAIYCYLRYSSKRQHAIGDLQKLLDIPEHRLLKLHKVRWLSLEVVIKRLIEQYRALVVYFENELKNTKKDNESASKILANLKNPYTLIYYEFLSYVLHLVNVRNAEFQAEDTKIHLLHTKMETLFKSIVEMYIDENHVDMYDPEFIKFAEKTTDWLPISNIQIGPTAKAELNSLSSVSPEDKATFRTVCRDFLIELATQIDMRFPFKSCNVKMLRELRFIEPQNLKHTADVTEVAHQFGYDVTKVHVEFKKLKRFFRQTDEKRVDVFWSQVESLKDGNGEPEFPLMPQIVRRIKLLPHSSANCERVFSSINLNKTKTRNRLGTRTLCGILRSKSIMRKRKSVLEVNFKPMLKMLSSVKYEFD